MQAYLDALQRYTEFGGRSSRYQYWMFFLINFAISFGLGFIDAMLGTFPEGGNFGLLSGLYALAVFIPGLAVFVRRMHDIGKSGWWFFIVFVPLVGVFVLLYFLVKEGDSGPNEYGPEPYPERDYETDAV